MRIRIVGIGCERLIEMIDGLGMIQVVGEVERASHELLGLWVGVRA